MTDLSDYEHRFKHVRFRREDGILEITLHSEGMPLQWGGVPHAEVEEAFLRVGRDDGNEVVILTGIGAEFSGPEVTQSMGRAMPQLSGQEWIKIAWEARNMLMNLMAIEVPMIAAVNGPAYRHAEMPLLCDIVIAAEDALFQDSAHFRGGLVPGDGMHVVMPLLMGINRARYFLLTGQKLGAVEAKNIGLVAEVLPRASVLPRARELARVLMRQNRLTRRHTRILLTERIRKELNEQLPFGLALEGLGIVTS